MDKSTLLDELFSQYEAIQATVSCILASWDFPEDERKLFVEMRDNAEVAKLNLIDNID